jgi:hypothetical protein
MPFAVLERVQMEVYQGQELVSARFGIDNIYKFGYCWFRYAGVYNENERYNGKLQWVNHVYDVFFPENENAIEFQFQLFPGCHCFVTPHYQADPAILKVEGKVLNALTGQLANFFQTGP